MQEKVRVEQHGLADFCKEIQRLMREGYEFDFDTNENYPTTFGSFYFAGMVKNVSEKAESTTEVQDNQDEPVVQEQQETPVRQPRKRNNS